MGAMVNYVRCIVLVVVLQCIAVGIIFMYVNQEPNVQSPRSDREAMLLEQAERKERVQSQCASTRLSNIRVSVLKRSVNNILVDDRHRVLYCYVPKAGSSWWKQKLLEMNSLTGNVTSNHFTIHNVTHLDSYGIKRLRTYSPSAIIYRLQQYYKVMFTRHPLTRLVSAFRDKFELRENPFFRYIPRMLRHVRNLHVPQSTPFAELPGYGLRFGEFLNYTFAYAPPRFRHNEHWAPVGVLCGACLVRYDFIGKLETFGRDARFVLSEVFNKSTADHPEVRHRTGSDRVVSLRYFRSVGDRILEAVKREYSRDAAMFGYSLHEY